MAYIDDLVTDVLALAGKDVKYKDTVRRVIEGVIADVNDQLSSEVLMSRRQLSLPTTGYLTLPTNCKRVIEWGEYDATTDRIAYPYEEITEADYHENFAGATAPVLPDGYRLWFFVDPDQSGALRVRAVPAPDAATTVLVRYFEILTVGNADRLPYRRMIVFGAQANMAEWFPNTASYAASQYAKAMADLKTRHGSIKRDAPRRQTAEAALHNALAAGLVS